MPSKSARAASAYRGYAVTTASPARLVVLVFERLVLDMERALAALEDGTLPHEHLIHAQELLAALLDGIDTSAWEHAPDLASIYTFVHRTLVDANVNTDGKKIRDCLQIVIPLRDAWKQAAERAGEMPPARRVDTVNV